MNPAPLILMAEDSLTQAMLLQDILERHGYAAVPARNGREALEILAESKPFLIISDIQMPEMDGYELCRRVKADPAHASTPVMLLTSLSSASDIIHGLECGADCFVVKPYEEAFLISRILSIQEDLKFPAEDPLTGSVRLSFEGKEYLISSGRRQILNLLLSTYEAALHSNRELMLAHVRLKAAQAQLIEAEKLQSLGRLAAGVAHEIRNPLSILEMAVTLLSDHAREEDMPVLNEMREAVRRTSVVVDGLIELSAKRETGTSLLDVREAIDSAMAPLTPQMEDAGIAIERDFEPCACCVRVDPARLDQLISNILANARDAMPNGGQLRVETRLRSVAPDDVLFVAGDRSGQRLRAGDRVVSIRFSDTGSGVASENLGLVFDPFFSTKPTGKGIGLGLTVARKIVDLYGGAISIENLPDGGARVSVTLKCADESETGT